MPKKVLTRKDSKIFTLTAVETEVYILYRQGLRQKDIAAKLNIPPATARNRLRIAREKVTLAGAEVLQ